MSEGKDINVWIDVLGDGKQVAMQFEKKSLSLYTKLKVCWALFWGRKMTFHFKGKIRYAKMERS